LSGLVRAATDGRPLREAQVTLLHPGGGVVAVTATDADGHYSFTSIPHGDYVVAAAGYRPGEERVAVASGRATSVDVRLGAATADDVYSNGRPSGPDRRVSSNGSGTT
jgi:hypothetical protein